MRELFLTSFSGVQYGIWKDETLSVRDINALHRIPLSPARIAGVMIDDGRTVTIADLTACIGHKSIREAGQGCILLKQEGDDVMGFMVSGELRTQFIRPELVFPLPAYLNTLVFDSCAIHEDIPIPLINITEIYTGVLKTDEVSSAYSLSIPDAQPQDIQAMSRIRIFTAGGELYALSAAGIEQKEACKPGPITPLPNTPKFVQGLIFLDGRLFPVIDVSQRIKSQSVSTDSLMLIAEIGSVTFGLLIDGDAGSMSVDKVSVKPLPLIAQTSWLMYVLVRSGEIIPLIDIAMALIPGSGADAEKPVWQRYAPDSGFPDVFFKHDVEVVEFSLLGERYALPKQEVEDVITFMPCRAIPDMLPIVIGVAEHKGEILPVVDLAMMFGRRSIATSEWRMMLVSNGDFRALVITESVYGERRLRVDVHRSVPIHLPHKLMYGCYPDEQAVRIILNVEAISVHFEKSLIQIFMPAFSQQMRMSPTGVVYTFPEEKAGHGEEPLPLATVTPTESTVPASAEAEPVAGAATETEPVNNMATGVPSTSTQESLSTESMLSGDSALDQEPLPPAEAVSDTTIAIEPEAIIAESTFRESMAEENIDLASAPSQVVPEFVYQAGTEDTEFVEWEEEEAAAPPIAPEPEQIDAGDAAVSEVSIEPETNWDAKTVPEPTVQLHSVSCSQSSGTNNKARESVGTSKRTALEALKVSGKIEHSQKVSSKAGVDSLSAEPKRTVAGEKPGTPYRMSKEVEQLVTLSGHEERSDSARKRRFAYGAIAVVLVAVLFYFSRSSDQSAFEISVQGIEPAKIEPIMAQPEPSKVETELTKEVAEQDRAERETKLQTEQAAKVKTQQTLVLSPLANSQANPPLSAESSRPPLELDIPKNRPTDIDVYVVQEGDTLWSISERFTGNPFNYPRIAGENRIADPDLIFPNQRIRLIK